jgi:GNAT superfamily N-acetyltransferase
MRRERFERTLFPLTGESLLECLDDESLQVRDAVLTDVEALFHLKPSAAVHRDRIRDAATSMLRYLVMEREERVIGFALLLFTRPPHWSDGNDSSRLPQVVDLVIAPDLRGRGFGTFLLRAIERLAAERGCSHLYLAVSPIDNPRAHALYVRCGYQPLQTEPYRSHWEFVDSAGELHQGDEWSLDIVKSLE